MSPLEITILSLVIPTNFVLAGLAYRRNNRSATHTLFALLTLVINAYLITNSLAVNATTHFAALWFTRSVMFFATPMSVLFFLLMHTFPKARFNMPTKAILFWGISTVVTMITALSPYLFTDVTVVPGKVPQPSPGLGLILFIPLGVGTIPLGFFYLVKKLRQQKEGIERIQLQFMLLGASIMYALIIAFIFIGTNAFGNSAFAKYAPLFTLPFVGLTAYVIIRHRLLDIRAALFRGLSLTFLISAVLGVYGLLLVFAVPLIATFTGISADILAGAAALVSIPIARLVQRGLTKLTDRFLFQNRVDYRKALVKLGRDLSSTINIEEVTSIILDAVRNIIRIKKTAILLRNPETSMFEPRGQLGMKDFHATIRPDNPLIIYFKQHQNVVSKDELTLAKEQQKDKRHLGEMEVVMETMQWLDVSVIIPLFVNKELTGLIIIGEKLSGTPYLQDDIEFLAGFATQAAVALENARLYQESLEFGERLQEEVERATAELEAANIQLKNLDKAKSEFLSIASHQLYTPLTALRGYVSMLQEGDFGKVPPKQEEVLDILNKSALRLIDLIKGLLDISRIEQGRLELNLESVDLAEMVKELVQDLMPNAIAKNLQLTFHPPVESLSHVVVDRQRVRQVMLNFIDNAIKYTPVGRIDVSVKKDNDRIAFAVKDTGKGISKEDQARLFNKFSRVGGAARFHTEGTGLGLYVAKQIVKEHHGELGVESPGEGKGSTFLMYLPVEGTPDSLKPGEHASVEIKAAEAVQTPEKAKV